MVRGLGLDLRSFLIPFNQLEFESLGFTGPGVVFGARALIRAEVTRFLVEVSNQTSLTVRSVVFKEIQRN